MPTPVSQITNYTELQEAIGDWLDRDDLPTQIQLYISLAEAEFNREIRNRNMEVRVTMSTTGGANYYDLPDDWEEQRSIVLISANYRKGLQFLSIEQMDMQARPYPVTYTGEPIWFTNYGNALRLLPVPDQAYTMELFYYQEIPPLATNGTNWLLAAHPDIYLFASLVQATSQLDERSQGADFQAKYTNAMASLNDEEKRDLWSAASIMPTTGQWTP
jgi:hypothetical protein